MPIDTSALPFSKGRPASLLRDDRRKRRESVDDRESQKVRKRSGGKCEISVVGEPPCPRRACHVHHMLGGIGVRGRGESAKSARKQSACLPHHEQITGKRLQRIGPALPHFKDRYRRVR